ncbi:MAG: GNAT family N-acetyltransferase [Bacteroidota bacterium]
MAYSNKNLVPKGFEIREYNSGDYPALEAFWNENGLGGKHRGDTPEVIEDTLEAGGHLLLLTDKEGNISGSSWMTNDRRRTYLHHFGIAGPLRGKGLANVLLGKSLLLAKRDGLQVKIEVHRENEIALNLYRKAGFKYLGDYDVYIIRELPE